MYHVGCDCSEYLGSMIRSSVSCNGKERGMASYLEQTGIIASLTLDTTTHQDFVRPSEMAEPIKWGSPNVAMPPTEAKAHELTAGRSRRSQQGPPTEARVQAKCPSRTPARKSRSPHHLVVGQECARRGPLVNQTYWASFFCQDGLVFGRGAIRTIRLEQEPA